MAMSYHFINISAVCVCMAKEHLARRPYASPSSRAEGYGLDGIAAAFCEGILCMIAVQASKSKMFNPLSLYFHGRNCVRN